MLDTEDICSFLEVPIQDIPNSGKEKRKLKKFLIPSKNLIMR